MRSGAGLINLVAMTLCAITHMDIVESKYGSQTINSKSTDTNDFELLGLGSRPQNGELHSESMDNINFLENSELINAKTTNLFKKYGMKPYITRREKRGDVHFGYEGKDGPDSWGEKFPECNGEEQSPVNLVGSKCQTKGDAAIQWRGYNTMPRSVKITNNGHTVMVQGEWKEEDGGRPRIRMRHCHEEFVFEQLHFHWGCDNTTGSEHTINNIRFPLEMHVVFYRADLGSMSKAAGTHGGLVVVGILFKLCKEENKNFGKLLKEFCRVREGPITADVTPLPLSTIIPLFSKHYYTYDGSLTTPPCSETVKWIVDTKQGTLSPGQLKTFHHFMYEGKLIKKNYRPLQRLNGRVIQQVK